LPSVIKMPRKKFYPKYKEQTIKGNRERIQKYKEGKSEYDRQRYLIHKKGKAEWHYLKRYNLTLEQIDEILVSQDHKCGLCGRSLKEMKRAVDHDHKTGKVRGILCNRCNLGLAMFLDNADLLKVAINYLTETKSKEDT